MSGLTRLLVTAESDGHRLDVFLASSTDLSRRTARRVVADGAVWRNGQPVRIQSRTVDAGDVIDVLLPPEELGVPSRPAAPNLDFLYHDRWLLVVDKPAGILTQPDESPESRDQALDAQVLAALAIKEGRRPFLRVVHRLDRLTSGAVIFACNPSILPALTRSWAGGSVDRRYIAVVEGNPSFDQKIVDRPIARDHNHRWRFLCDESGKPARTEVSVLSRPAAGTAVVQCRLVTGRTHQVRVHLADAGHPVLGDRLYGSLREEASRPLLHAFSLALPHPESGKPLTVVSPIPDDMRRFVPPNLVGM